MGKSLYVDMDRFGKDHWSLLGYVECCCVNSSGRYGELELCRMRTRTRKGWKSTYGTRLKGFFDSQDSSLQLSDHDDLNCLDDLEDAGLIEVVSMVNLWVKMTDFGCKVAAQLRTHKTKGGHFANFEYKEKK